MQFLEELSVKFIRSKLVRVIASTMNNDGGTYTWNNDGGVMMFNLRWVDQAWIRWTTTDGSSAPPLFGVIYQNNDQNNGRYLCYTYYNIPKGTKVSMSSYYQGTFTAYEMQ